MKTDEQAAFSKFSDEEVISEGVKRLFKQYEKRGGDKCDLFDFAFVITLNYRDEYLISLERRQKFYSSQPALKLMKPLL